MSKQLQQPRRDRDALKGVSMADDNVLAWSFEDHPEHLDGISYRCGADGADPEVIFQRSLALRQYGLWCRRHRVGTAEQ